MDANLLPAGFMDGYMLADSSWVFSSGSWEWSDHNGSYGSRPMVVRMDKDFNITWQKAFGEIFNKQWFTDLEQTANGDFIASGNLWREYEEGVLFSRAAHYKFKANGDSLWMRQDSVLEDAWVMGTDLLSSGSIISIGYTDKYGAGGGRFGFLIKIGADGCIDTLNCWPVGTDEDLLFPQQVEVYPNPIVDDLTVSMLSSGTIWLYDGMGRFLRKQALIVGQNAINVHRIPKGMLFYEIRKGDVVLSRGKLVKE